jgi:hypothetical protein
LFLNSSKISSPLLKFWFQFIEQIAGFFDQCMFLVWWLKFGLGREIGLKVWKEKVIKLSDGVWIWWRFLIKCEMKSECWKQRKNERASDAAIVACCFLSSFVCLFCY